VTAKGLTWNKNHRRIAESILKYLKEDKTGYDASMVRKEVPDAGDTTIFRVYTALKKNKFKIPPFPPKPVLRPKEPEDDPLEEEIQSEGEETQQKDKAEGEEQPELIEESPSGNGSKETKTSAKKGVRIASVGQRKQGAILFILGDENIELEPRKLYDAYLYYLSIQRIDPEIDDDFSTVIKTSVKNSWERVAEIALARNQKEASLVVEEGPE
jgi:hypothetical protein